MSTACPSCGQDINEDFGFVTCSQCGALLVIDMDGNASLGDQEHAGDSTSEFEAGESEGVDSENIDEANSGFEDLNLEDSQLENSEQEGFEQEGQEEAEGDWEDSEYNSEEPLGDSEGGLSNSEELDDFSEDEPAEESALESDFQEEDDKGVDEGGGEAVSSEWDESFGEESSEDYGEGQIDMQASPHFETGGTGLAQDLADYGNSDLSQAKDGMLRFNLLISGIDTPDIRYAIKEALTDRKFIWEASEILAQTNNGELKIEGITAVKAALVVKRIRNLPIEIRWEQYAISQT